jgi:hypothetical protein
MFLTTWLYQTYSFRVPLLQGKQNLQDCKAGRMQYNRMYVFALCIVVWILNVPPKNHVPKAWLPVCNSHWGHALKGDDIGTLISSSLFSLPCAPTMMFCLVTGPKAVELIHNGLKLLKPAKINLSSWKVVYFRYFVIATEGWLTRCVSKF